MKNILTYVIAGIYNIGLIATFGKLTFFDGFVYTWWNWIVAVPANGVLSVFWPVYWPIIRPVFGS